jgi:hypothetical protein
VGDFDGDGKQDLAVPDLNQTVGTVSIRLATGAGGFANAPDLTFGASASARFVAVGDFNGDGKPDLAVAKQSFDSMGNMGSVHTVAIFLGNGTGAFDPAQEVAVGVNPVFVAVRDFNGDGKPDLAIANQDDGGAVNIRLGTGDGHFIPAPDILIGQLPISVAVADFNGDGRQDLAITSYSNTPGSAGAVSIRLGTGNGSFTVEPDIAVGISPGSVAVGDFNGDGLPDLAVANGGNKFVTVLLNTVPNPHPQSQPAPPRQIVAVAFRKKGVSRVRVKDAATGAVRAVLTPFPGFGGRLRLQLLDVNGDGSLDLVVQAILHGKRKKKVFDAITLARLA